MQIATQHFFTVLEPSGETDGGVCTGLHHQNTNPANRGVQEIPHRGVCVGGGGRVPLS